jgi:hypothetical protein
MIPKVFPFGLDLEKHHLGIVLLKRAVKPCKGFTGLIKAVV